MLAVLGLVDCDGADISCSINMHFDLKKLEQKLSLEKVDKN